MRMKPETVSVTCAKCGMTLPVPAGGKRLCGCGAWISAAAGTPALVPMNAIPVEIPMESPPVAQPTRAYPAVRPLAPPPSAQASESFPRIEGDLAAIERLNDGYRRINKELGKAIVGQQKVIEELLIAIFARGHCLLVGVPGLAKTLMIRT